MRPVSAALTTAALALAIAAGLPAAAGAHAPSGAIFTTLVDGSEVNFNHYPSKEAVYLDGGPGPGAPQHAAGLDPGTYVFQVTDPSGKTLLSEDEARCRQFTVAADVISGVVDTDCEHFTGLDVDHGATTVQLFPYLDTPNPGGVYKVWVTRLEDFLLGCSELGEPNGLDVVDCGDKEGGNAHGFIPSHSKTDNFKVKAPATIEIDTRFTGDHSTEYLDGFGVTWEDPLGATNRKWSYWAPELNVFHEAHVEAVENGTHKITIDHQPGCQVDHVHYAGKSYPGPQTISVPIRNQRKDLTVFIDVHCH